jgi:hypothetical protein
MSGLPASIASTRKHATLRWRSIGWLAQYGYLYLFSVDGLGVFIKLPAAQPTRAMLKNTQTIPSEWPNTNPPSSHKTTEMSTDKTSKRTLESMMSLSNKMSDRAGLLAARANDSSMHGKNVTGKQKSRQMPD